MIQRFLILYLFFLWSAFSSAQAENEPQVIRTIAAEHVETTPVIDGKLDDPCWQAAGWQGDFFQLKPLVGKAAQAPTQVAVAYDERHIYVAFRCFNPPGISSVSRITRRDGNLDIDNAVTVYLDTFHSRRDCYYFSTNSLGTQVDGRIGEDGRSNDKNWDCTWKVVSREDSSGWTSEIAIPVNEIRLPEDTNKPWGMNFRRNCPEVFETSFWSEQDRVSQVSRFGDLDGLTGFKKRFSAKFYPYVVTLDTNTPSASRKTVYSSGGTEIITGADMRYNIGATATGNLTYNPEFATVEADQEVINLTRYETYFPEKRLYFLEGSELFRNRINVFYSRRIGNIDYGLKTSGRYGKNNFALLTASERASGEKPSSQNTVLRLQRDILGSSNIGMLLVDRTFNGGYNRVLSTDATIYLPSHVRVTSQYVGSFPSGDAKFTNAYFLRAARETDIYHYHLRYTNIDPGFRENVNTVGFIRDDNRRELDSDIDYHWWIKKHNIEKVDFSFNGNVFWGHGGALRSLNLTQFAGVTFTNRLFVGLSGNYHNELFEKRYYNHTITPEIGYNLEQWNSYTLLYQHGRNFDSDMSQWVLRSHFKPNDRLSLEYRVRHLKLSPDPDKRSTVLHVLTTDYNFTPNLYLRLFTQSSSRNDRFYLYGLFGWRFSPPFGALYLAYTKDMFDLVDELHKPISREEQRALFLKLTVPVSF